MEKLIDIIRDIIEKDPPEVKIIIKTQNLEKKSKMRTLFEKEKSLTCIPVYEDDARSLNPIIQDFLKKKDTLLEIYMKI